MAIRCEDQSDCQEDVCKFDLAFTRLMSQQSMLTLPSDEHKVTQTRSMPQSVALKPAGRGPRNRRGGVQRSFGPWLWQWFQNAALGKSQQKQQKDCLVI